MELLTIRFRDFLYFIARIFFWVVVGVFLWWFLAEGASKSLLGYALRSHCREITNEDGNARKE